VDDLIPEFKKSLYRPATNEMQQRGVHQPTRMLDDTQENHADEKDQDERDFSENEEILEEKYY